MQQWHKRDRWRSDGLKWKFAIFSTWILTVTWEESRVLTPFCSFSIHWCCQSCSLFSVTQMLSVCWLSCVRVHLWCKCVNYCNWFRWLGSSRVKTVTQDISQQIMCSGRHLQSYCTLCLCLDSVFVFVWRECTCVIRGQPGGLAWVKLLADDFSYNEQGEAPMMRNHLFINKRQDEMEQPVLNLKTVKLSKPTRPSPRLYAAAADGNPACHNHQPLWTKWSIE